MELECGLIELRTPKGKAKEATGQSEGRDPRPQPFKGIRSWA